MEQNKLRDYCQLQTKAEKRNVFCMTSLLGPFLKAFLQLPFSALQFISKVIMLVAM